MGSGLLPMWALQIINLAVLGLYVAAIVLFIMWFRRGYTNLHRLRYPGLSSSESAAAWWWFIPLLNLYQPYKIAEEMYKVYVYLAYKVTGSTDYPPVNQLVLRWWLWFLGTTVGVGLLSAMSAIVLDLIGYGNFDTWMLMLQLATIGICYMATTHAVAFISKTQGIMDEVYSGEDAASAAIHDLEP